jgi:hypothetical protein
LLRFYERHDALHLRGGDRVTYIDL